MPQGGTGRDFAQALHEFCLQLSDGQSPASVCVATAGEVAPDGKGYIAAAKHLGVMGTNEWQSCFQDLIGCPFWMLNDAEAFLVGAAEERLFSPTENVAALVVGTGLGFCFCKEGRWWKPNRRLALLGALWSPDGTYDALASAVAVQKKSGGSLARLFTAEETARDRNEYLNALAGIAAGVCCLCHPDRILFGGGLGDAATECDFPLADEICKRLPPLLPRGVRAAEVSCVPRSNTLTLAGALSIAEENGHADIFRFRSNYATLPTESAVQAKGIEAMPPTEIVARFWEEEQQAGLALETSLASIARMAQVMADTCAKGGRVIYVGAGTSGRIAALDAVEMPCTYGLDRTQFTAIIAGGGVEAAWDIERDHEEDITSIPDLLLMQPGPEDMVIGITVSGTAFFVRSALASARRRGAFTLLIHEAPTEQEFYDQSIRIHSGPELVGGSTRMKGGTATKRILNWMGTTAMILLGKTHDGWMIDFQTVNDKLKYRATRILAQAHDISIEKASKLLSQHGNCLRSALNMSGQSPT